jgi:hypothetical protein
MADESPIPFTSLESRTTENGRVHNRIAFIPGVQKDVWMMQQSHSGLGAAYEKWDRLAIVVDKTVYPRVARFYQLVPGAVEDKGVSPLTVPFVARAIPYKVPCFMCHPNGPRAVRPDTSAADIPLSFYDKIKIELWNIRIKTYGRVISTPTSESLKDPAKPFRFSQPLANEKLDAPTCRRCHNDKWYGRGYLTQQNIFAARFMVTNGFMPPPGFSASTEDLEILGVKKSAFATARADQR